MKKHRNIFPNNNETLAYYDQFRHIINLCLANQFEFEEIKSSMIINEKSNYIWSIYAHELTHWIDHMTTLWGQENLVLQYNAMNARISNKTEEFWRIKYYDDYCKTESQSSYYTQIVEPDFSLQHKKWYLTKSCSPRFDLNGKVNSKRPLFYITIYSEEDSEIARIPLTVAALLECRAIQNEFHLRLDTINSFYSEKQIAIAKNKLNDDFYNTIFEPSLILYSIIGYLTMFTCNLYDLNKISELSSIVSNISLNFPKSLVSKIKNLKRGDLNLQNSFDLLLNNRDYGFIFYTLIENASKIDFSKKIEVDEILNCSNLPNEKEFKQIVIAEMKLNCGELIDGVFTNSTKKLINKGIDVFLNSDLNAPIFYMFPQTNEYFCPRLMFNDSIIDKDLIKEQHTVQSLIEKQNKSFEEYYVLFDFFEDKFSEFIEACGM